jgi:hypothetical protein
MTTSKWLLKAGAPCLVWALTACGGGTQGSADDFVSDNPHSSGGDRGDDGGAASSAGDDSGDESGGDDDGGREIAEADIVALQGDRLYALSRFGGLAVIDASNPTSLPVLGRFRANATPFEMYVEGDQIFVMFSEYGSYGWDAELGGYTWHTASRLIALDASDPANIVLRGEFELPGELQDSRRVGEILYLVTHENGSCWGCKSTPNTTVTSLDISDVADAVKVDELSFSGPENDGWWGGRRSVSATDQRMYIAGFGITDWNEWESSHSVIDVVDISDPGGALVHGTTFAVAGVIQSRWQMDEHDGVLRVVSQPGFWGGTTPPMIETFSVASATDLTPLGELQMVLPRPESLRSVRFDGPRGYAITFEQTDPLFTLDLSDPSLPRQVGELEIPGWVHHMETRDDRILGLGYEWGAEGGSINVSLFDVSDFENPTMLSRVHFGGDWANFAEDQDRLHKAFTILDDLGLLMVPFSGWSWDDGDHCNGNFHSGIQLVDWADDQLTLRGVADSHGQARRALLHRDHLLGVSDLAVESFDISDRDHPTRVADLALATNVTKVAIAGDLVVRLATDWWTDASWLDVVSRENAESPEPLGRLSLSELTASRGYECWGGGLWGADLFTHAGHVFIVRDLYDYETWSHGRTAIDVIDIRNPAAPAYLETIEIDAMRSWWGHGTGLSNDEKRAVHVGRALILTSTQLDWEIDEVVSSHSAFHLVDVGDPTNIQVTKLDRPDGIAHGGMQVFGSDVVSWHMQSASGDASKVRFYLERIDLSQPSNPSMAEPINVPGQVVAYDPSTQRAVTLDFRLASADLGSQECWSHPKAHWSGYDDDSCMLAHRELKLVQLSGSSATLVDTQDVEGEDAAVRAVAASTERLFVQLRRGSYVWSDDWNLQDVPRDEIAVFSSWLGNTLEPAATVELEGAGWWVGALRAVGHHLLFRASNGIGELDASNPQDPRVEIHDLVGWGCHDLQIEGRTAYCALGQFGLQTLSF